MASTDVTVERIQNRRGKKIDLPQPLRPGEYGLCTDTRELFIGGDPDEIGIAAVQVYSSPAGLYQAAQGILDQQIIRAETTAFPTGNPTSPVDLAALASTFATTAGMNSAETNIHYIEETGELYVGGSIIPDEITALITEINSTTGVTSGTAHTTAENPAFGLQKIVDADGGIIFNFHSQSNAVAALLNSLHGVNVPDQAIATSKLNIKVFTEVDTFELPVDLLVEEPIEIILPQSATFTAIPTPTSAAYNLLFDATISDTINIDYSIMFKNTTLSESYSSNGRLQITTNKELNLSELTDENTISSNIIDEVDFQAVYLPGTDEVQLEYKHNFNIGTDPVLMKLTMKRWLSF